MAECTDFPANGASRQPGQEDFTAAEEHSIIGDRQMQDLVRVMEAMPSPSHGAVMRATQSQQALTRSGSNLPGTQMNPVSGAMMQANQSNQVSVHSRENPTATQMIPVDVSGGEFGSAYFGPISTSRTKNVGFEGGDFRDAHFGPKFETKTVIYESTGSAGEPGLARPACSKHNGNCRKLTNDICLFPNKKLSASPKSKVFEGAKTSAVLGDQPLAIKCALEFTEQNKREAKNLVKLRPHTNVVTILHADVCSQGPMEYMFLAMERCSTVNLESYIMNRREENIPYNIQQAVEHSKQIVGAIQHIHGNDIIHRDLKPSSILFSLCGRYLKICDFGMSKELENGRSVISLSMLKVGTDGYRAPETYNKNVLTKMADIYSLALVLHHLLSYGFHPHGLDPESWNFNIKNGKNLHLGRLRAPFLEIAKPMFGKMLKFKPKDRLKIEKVVDKFQKLDWMSSLTKVLVEAWNGVIKGASGANVLSCKLLSRQDALKVLKIDGSDWAFQMNTFPNPNIGSLKKVIDEEPSGYIATSSRDELKKLTCKLSKNKLMAWIDISKRGKERKVLVLISHQDYPELFGYFLPNPKIVSSILGERMPKQSKTGIKKIADESTSAALSQALTQPKVLEPTRETHEQNMNQEQGGASARRQAFTHPKVLEPTRETCEQDPIEEQADASTASPHEETLGKKELIPWWIISENLQ